MDEKSSTYREAPGDSSWADISPIPPTGGEQDNSNDPGSSHQVQDPKQAMKHNDRVRVGMSLFEGIHGQLLREVFRAASSPSMLHAQDAAAPLDAIRDDDPHLTVGGFLEAIGLHFPTHPHPVVMVPSTGKEYRYTLKEGEPFEVYLQLYAHAPLRGLHFTNTVYKLGIAVDKTKRHMGSLPACAQPYTLYAITERAPSGVLMRGSYKGNVLLVEEGGAELCNFNYRLDVKKQWDEDADSSGKS